MRAKLYGTHARIVVVATGATGTAAFIAGLRPPHHWNPLR